MGFSFRALYQWLLDKNLTDKEITEDDFIYYLNGYTSPCIAKMHDHIIKLEAELKELKKNDQPIKYNDDILYEHQLQPNHPCK